MSTSVSLCTGSFLDPAMGDPDHALRSSPTHWLFGSGFRKAEDLGVPGPHGSGAVPTSCSTTLCWARSNSVSSLNICLSSLSWFTTPDSLSLMAASRPSSSSLRYHVTRTMIFGMTKQHLSQRERVGRMFKCTTVERHNCGTTKLSVASSLHLVEDIFASTCDTTVKK